MLCITNCTYSTFTIRQEDDVTCSNALLWKAPCLSPPFYYHLTVNFLPTSLITGTFILFLLMSSKLLKKTWLQKSWINFPYNSPCPRILFICIFKITWSLFSIFSKYRYFKLLNSQVSYFFEKSLPCTYLAWSN